MPAPLPERLGWLTFASIAAVVAVNAAGVWEIAVSRRGAVEEARHSLQLEVVAGARSLESLLSATRADLLFMTGSPPFSRLEEELTSTDPREARWRRLAVGASLLLFLRAHPEISHLVVRSAGGAPLVAAGRRGGAPVLWMPSEMDADRSATGPAAMLLPVPATSEPQRRSVRGEMPPAALASSPHLEARLDAAALLANVRASARSAQSCELRDATGAVLAPAQPSARPAVVTAAVSTAGWSAASPWSLACARGSAPGLALLEPLTSRYRTTLLLNLGVMGVTLLLGSLAIQQARRRALLEAAAREEARVRELERRLFHAERLGTVGRFAAGIAHEVNNPLEGMSNYLRLAENSLEQNDAGAARRHLERLGEGLRRAAAIIHQVLLHAEPGAAPRTRVDLHPILTETVEFVRARREFRAHDFRVEVPNGSLKVVGDPVTLGQVFLNLLLNACEAQPAGGEVSVCALRRDRSVIVEIADRGPGIPAADRDRVFEPFHTTKESTGLGLSICHSIVRQHEGDLTVEDRPGGGALFRLRLPAAEETESGGGAEAHV